MKKEYNNTVIEKRKAREGSLPKVSIILPSLNVISYIRETIESVCTQTMQDIEIICVDAGSTDGTLEVLKEFAQSDKRIRILHSDKKSYGYQMNLGFREASGEYIGIVETDDYISPEMYEVLYDTAIGSDADVVKSDFDMFTTRKNGEHLLVNYSLKSYNRVAYNEIYSKEQYINGEFAVECYIWNAIYKKSFLEKHGIIFNETPGASFQDFGFKYQVAFAAERIIAVNQSFYRYRRDNSGSSTYNSRTAEFNLRESKFLLSVLDKWHSDDRTYAAAAREILQFAVWPYMEICKWSEPAPGTEEALQEYHLMFQEFAAKQYIDGTLVDWNLWKGFHLLLESEDLFDKYVRVTSRLERDRIRSVLQAIKCKDQVVIYGCGKRGTGAHAFLVNNKCDNLVAFCDGNESKWNEKINGLKVISPDIAVQKYPNAVFLITATGAQGEIRKHLNELQVDKANIMIYNLPTDPLFCTNCMVLTNVK